MTTTITGRFEDINQVDNAIKALKNQGFDLGQISLKSGPEVLNAEIEAEAANREMMAGVMNGAITGAALGLMVGLVWGLSAIPTPGLNPGITGEALRTLLAFIGAGIAIGAALGGLLLASLVKLGLSSEKGNFRINGIRQKSVLVAVQTPDERISEVKHVLHDARTIEETIS